MSSMAINVAMVSIVIVLQLFVLLNPFSTFPFLLAAYEKKLNLRRIAIGAVVTAYIVAVIIAICGPILFSLFGVTLDAFRVAGGIILLLLGIDMIRSNNDEEHLKVDRKGDHLISIIATPMLTGPATISYVTIQAGEIGLTPILINLTIAFVFVAIIFYLMTIFIAKINPTIVNIISRILGLFLTAVAVQMIFVGAKAILGLGV